ncbi:uncharacterized protein LOC131856569 [Cryptomeria japonica]|uniref:uncharacterized protein LOC131856569 n=1 Tax=Cryptomeria japonica TaxID=3369 RepID=UPI0027DA0601|nr:uncharacterized protein LOC131856569 [Cryptomeria japonica]
MILRLGAIPRPTSDGIDITDIDRSNQDIVIDCRDDVGMHRSYITWWRRTYPRAIFRVDFPGGNPEPWRQTDREGSDTSKEGSDDQADKTREQEEGGHKDDPDTREGDLDGDDDEDREEEEKEDQEEDDEEKYEEEE